MQDTCGVHSLHGMPGVMGAVVSAICIAVIGKEGYPDNYFPLDDGESIGR